MYFERIEPAKHLQRFIDCYWIVKNEDTEPREQKIIPDGFIEIIFHFADPYYIKLDDRWQLQSKHLLGGQITRHFYLKNTGASDMTGIKLKPTALTHLFGIPASDITDKVPDLSIIKGHGLDILEKNIRAEQDQQRRIELLEEYFTTMVADCVIDNDTVDRAVELINARNGMIAVSDILSVVNLSERQFERLFKKKVGVSPKFYARIIRFNYIFRLKENKKEFWNDLALDAAYYDQSHFIRNFKAFTGENPSDYFFDEKNMANFFLKMSRK